MTMLPSRSLKTSSWLKGLVKKKKNSVTSTTSSGHNTSSTRTSSQGATSASSGRPISNGPLLAAHNGPAWNSNHWKRAIEKAKTRLDEDEKETFQQFSSKDSLSAAIHYTDGVYNEAKNRQWIRTDRIHRILNSLQSFAKVGDICIQHSPEVTSLVWGSVRFLLQYGINILGTREELFTALEAIVMKTAVCEYYSRMTDELQTVMSQAGNIDGLKAIFDECLPEFYAAVLIFIVKATKYFGSRTERVLRGWEQYDAYFKPFMNDIERREAIVKECSNMSEIAARRESSNRVSEIHLMITEMRNTWGGLLTDIQQNVGTANDGINVTKSGIEKILTENDEKTLLDCRKWLNFFDPNPEYKRHRRAQMKGTGLWIFNDPKVAQWLGLENGILCIQGNAGTGKSVLTSFIIEHLQKNVSTVNARCVHIYFFFRNGDDRTAGPATMVASLIEQLFRSAADDDLKRLFGIIKPSYNKYGSSACSEEELWKLLSTMIESFSMPVMVFLDALDECMDPTSVISHLNDIKARILVTSRPEPHIIDALEQYPPNHIVLMDPRHDIDMFISFRVRSDNRLGPHRDAIISKVKQTADGLFLYAVLMLDELRRTTHQRKVTDILQSLPNGLNEMYVFMLKRLPPELEHLRKTTFMFISGAFRPVTIAEVAFANGVDPGENFDPDEVLIATKEEILEACGSLVEVFESTIEDIGSGRFEVLRFSHLTVKDFLLSNPSAMYIAGNPFVAASNGSFMLSSNIRLHGSIASVCVSLLSEKAFISSNGSKPSPLLYSVQYALRHASVVTEAGVTHPRTLYDDLLRLLDKDSPRFQLWKSSLPLYWRDFDINHTTPLFLLDESARQLLDPLHIMASYGFFDLLREELNSRLDVTVLDGHGRTPLSWAAFGGHERLAELLLARGGVDSINMADNHDLSPLSLAAWNGHAKVVKVLLAQDGIDVNHVDKSTETPLLKAAIYGHQEVVQLLLSRDDINSNAVDSDGRTPLLRAATNGSKEVVELLLAHDGVDISKASNIGEMPLWAAAASGHKEVLELLIGQGGMDINTTNDEGETGLFRAASIGSKDVVELLLAQDGVDVNKDYEGRTPLWTAAAQGRTEVVRVLLCQDGVKLNRVDSIGRTPLHMAAFRGREEAVELLLARGMDINTVDKRGRTALHMAALRNREEVVKVLLAHGVNVNKADNNGATALSIAEAKEHHAIVEIIQSHPESTTAIYRTTGEETVGEASMIV